MFNKKIITALMLITVFIVGLQMAEPVNAIAGKVIDKGSFNVNGKKVAYNTELVGNSLYLDFYCGKIFEKYYRLDKVNKKNQIKAYKYDDKKNKYVLVKTYNTNKNLKSFYLKIYKPSITKQVKSDFKKVLKW